METNQITEQIIGAAIDVHKAIGPGLLESVYQACLARELHLRNLSYEMEKAVPVQYKDVYLECGCRLDFLVEKRVVVELKSVDRILPIHEAQLLTYLRMTGIATGLLINFNVLKLKDGIKRMVD